MKQKKLPCALYIDIFLFKGWFRKRDKIRVLLATKTGHLGLFASLELLPFCKSKFSILPL